MNMDVAPDASRVTSAPYIPVQALAARVRVENGKAIVVPLRIAVGEGTLRGTIQLDGRTDYPKAAANLIFQNVDLAPFFRDSRYFSATQGKLEGRMALEGTGRSLAQVMGFATGDFAIGMTGGTISALLVDLAGLDIADALLLYIASDHRIPIRCAMGRLVFEHGVARFDKALMDTRKSVLHFDGYVGLKQQTMTLKITADAKEFSLANLHAPILLNGKIRSPSITIDRAIPIPTPDLGGAKDVACDQRMDELLATQ